MTFRRALTVLVSACWLFLLATAVVEADWPRVALYGVAALLYGLGWVLGRVRPAKTPDAEVSATRPSHDDIARLTAHSRTRVEAVKALRLAYPALGLGEAVELVDESRERR